MTSSVTMATKKTLGQIAYEAQHDRQQAWIDLELCEKKNWEDVATAVEREVIQYMKR